MFWLWPVLGVSGYERFYCRRTGNLLTIERAQSVGASLTVSRACVDRLVPWHTTQYAPSALGIRHWLYCFKVFWSASKRCFFSVRAPVWMYEGLVSRLTLDSWKIRFRENAPLVCGWPHLINFSSPQAISPWRQASKGRITTWMKQKSIDPT